MWVVSSVNIIKLYQAQVPPGYWLSNFSQLLLRFQVHGEFLIHVYIYVGIRNLWIVKEWDTDESLTTPVLVYHQVSRSQSYHLGGLSSAIQPNLPFRKSVRIRNAAWCVSPLNKWTASFWTYLQFRKLAMIRRIWKNWAACFQQHSRSQDKVIHTFYHSNHPHPSCSVC